MGNCVCVTDNTTPTYSRDNWGSFNTRTIRRRRRTAVFHDDGENLLGEKSRSSSTTMRREIKIRMTKKQLEDLMSNNDLKGLTAEEILYKLLSDGGGRIRLSTVDPSSRHRPWKAALQTISEIN